VTYRIEVRPYGDQRMEIADLESMTYRFHAEGPTGIYRSVVTAFDGEGRRTQATWNLAVTAPGFVMLGDAVRGAFDPRSRRR
jgi:hypothetical protein